MSKFSGGDTVVCLPGAEKFDTVGMLIEPRERLCEVTVELIPVIVNDAVNGLARETVTWLMLSV